MSVSNKKRIQTFTVLECPAFIPDKSNDNCKDNCKEGTGLPRMKWTTELKRDAFRMREEGLTAAQIAERIGVTPVSVYKLFSNQKARERKEAMPKVEKVKIPPPPEAIPCPLGKTSGQNERDELFERLVFRAFDLAVAHAQDQNLPIEIHWRTVIGEIESILDGCATIVRKHAELERYFLKIAAVLALDAIPQKTQETGE